MISTAEEADAWRYFIAGVDDIYLTIDELLHRPEWHSRAACRGQGPESFFPERGQSTAPAKALCDVCPVQTECLGAGLVEEAGIWGGLAPRPRLDLVRSSSFAPNGGTEPLELT